MRRLANSGLTKFRNHAEVETAQLDWSSPSCAKATATSGAIAPTLALTLVWHVAIKVLGMITTSKLQNNMATKKHPCLKHSSLPHRHPKHVAVVLDLEQDE